MEIVVLAFLVYIGTFIGFSTPEIEEVGGSNFVLIHHDSDAVTPNPFLDPKTHFWMDPKYRARSQGGKELDTLDCSSHGRSIISVYDKYKDEIDSTLNKIHSAGQNKISLVLWHSSVDATSLLPNQNKACLSVHTEGLLNPHDSKNLAALVKKIQEIGFTQINFRFAAIDIPRYYYNREKNGNVYSYIGPRNRSHSWGSCEPAEPHSNSCQPDTIVPVWNEKVYQENWNVLFNTRNLVLKTLDPTQCQAKSDSESNPCSGINTTPKVIFDIGLEYGGTWIGTIVNNIQRNNCQYNYPEIKNDITNVDLALSRGCVSDAALQFSNLQKRYANRLWSNYSSNFGNKDTMGFSIAPAYPNYVLSTIEMYDESVTRQRPLYYGFDVYGNQSANHDMKIKSIDASFALIMRELKAKGEQHKTIFLQETYFNSSDMRQAIHKAHADHGLSLKYVFQWPLKFEVSGDKKDNVTDLSPIDQYLP